MKDLEEQCVCVKFCFKLGKTFTETFQMLKQVYGEDCLSRTQCREWYQRFKSGRTSNEDDPKTGRPSTSMDDDHVKKVLAVIRQNRRLTVREGAKGAVCGLRSAHFAGECALLKPEKCHLFLPSPMHACPRHGPRATSSDG